jgi:DNA-binding CsgD family transcriptional regulator
VRATLSAAHQAFFDGSFETCLTACDRIVVRDDPLRFELGLLRARVLLRLDRADKAIEALRECAYTATSFDMLLTGEMLLGAAYVRLGQHERGEALLANAHGRCGAAHPTVRAELALNLGVARYNIGQSEAADALLASVSPDADIVYARSLEYRGWIAFSQARFDVAGSWFRSALKCIERCQRRDRFVEANVLYGVAYANAELLETAGWEAAERRIAAFDWSVDGVARPRFWAAISCSMMYESLGDEQKAREWTRRAEQQAPSDAHRALALCRTAELFHGFREPRAQFEFTSRAVQLYETIDARKLNAEQQQLPVIIAEQLAIAHAYDDADRLMTHYREVVEPIVTTGPRDDRFAGVRHCVEGALCEGRGDRNGAVRSYTLALHLFIKTRYRRRAAGVALRLAHLTGARRYVAYATAALREAHPRFYMAVDLSALRDEATPALTDNQRVILKLVAQGKTYKDIAQMLGRSWKTVNNSVEQLRLKFGAGTRGELVAEVLRRGLVDVGDRADMA